MNRKLLAGCCLTALWVALVAGQAAPVPARQAAPARPAASAPAEPAARTPAGAAPIAAPAAADVTAQRALVNQYCVTCHNARLKTANLLLDQLDLSRLAEHREIADKVVRKMRAGLMPPTDARRPDPATLKSLIRWMEGELDRTSSPHLPAPGLHCPQRGGTMKVIAVIEPACAGRQVRLILDHLGHPTAAPSFRAPPDLPDTPVADQPREWPYEPPWDDLPIPDPMLA